MEETKPQLLIVDDDAGMRSTLADVLEDTGYEVKSLGEGKEAMDWFNTNSSDVVIDRYFAEAFSQILTQVELQ